MTRKFITGVQCIVTPEQYREIAPELEALGKKGVEKEIFRSRLLKIYHSRHSDGNLFNTLGLQGGFEEDSYVTVAPYNKDLILALAAMSEGEELFAGEYVRHDRWIGNKVYKYLKTELSYDYILYEGVEYKYNEGYLRKATVEEILNHFSPKTLGDLPKFVELNRADFEVQEEFKLPERWAVRRNFETYRVINNYFNTLKRGQFTSNGTGTQTEPSGKFITYTHDYLHYPKIKRDTSSVHHEIWNGWTEITFEQFKQYVLKEKTNNMAKKIIGYKAPMDLFSGEIKKGRVYETSKTSDISNSTYAYPSGTRSTLYTIPTEIVETWEPVYEATEKVIKIGTPAITVTIHESGDLRIKEYNTTDITVDNIKLWIKTLTGKQAKFGQPYFVKEATLHFGCSEGPDLTLKDLQTIVDAHGSIKD